MKVAFDQISNFAQFVSADYSNNYSCQPQDQRLTIDLRTKFIAGLQAHPCTSAHSAGRRLCMRAAFKVKVKMRRPQRGWARRWAGAGT